MESLIINFFGGPGIGKSTQSAGLFSEMKKSHMDVELTYEFPKIVTWEGNLSAISDQFYITANQHRNISRLYGKVRYIIVDSPIILGLIYKEKYSDPTSYPVSFYDDKFDDFIVSLFKKYRNLNILLTRNEDEFDENGRFQNLSESKELDLEIRNKLIDLKIPFAMFEVHNNTPSVIFKYITDNYL